MSDSIILCELDPQREDRFFQRRNEIRSRYLALIDQGRWFFVNDRTTEFGQWKHGAYQGLSPGVIEDIQNALRLVEELDYSAVSSNPTHRAPIVECKRSFTTHIQDRLNPDAVFKEIEAVRNETGSRH